VSDDSYWNIEMPAARCKPPDFMPPSMLKEKHDSPSPGCMCGYWSLKPELLQHPDRWHWPTWGPESVIGHGIAGWIEQWGKVDEYELGYRSQYARVTALIAFSHEWVVEHTFRMITTTYPITADGMRRMSGRYLDRVTKVALKYNLPIRMHDG
jgi:hypothetical protein